MTAVRSVGLLPDTAEVGARRLAVDRRLLASPTWPRSTARRCSSTTRRTCGRAAAKQWRRSAQGTAVYATKAFLCKAMARLAYDEGMLLDVASGGEMYVALAAGVPAGALTLHGNNKSVDELRAAITAGVRHIVVDSFDELDRLDALARRGSSGAGACWLASRRACTPTPTSSSPPDRTTRSSASTSATATRNARSIACVDRPSVELVGLHCHIGSNVFAASNFAKAAEVMAGFAVPLDLPELVLGGGLGVAYVDGRGGADDHPVGQRAARCVRRRSACAAGSASSRVGRSSPLQRSRCTRSARSSDIPGRAHVRRGRWRHERQPPAGAVRQRVRGVPAAPTLRRRARCTARLVGKHCESGDVLIFDAMLPADITVGDLLATPVTGAYGRSMASNYNMLTRPPVVFVADGSARLVVRRGVDGRPGQIRLGVI